MTCRACDSIHEISYDNLKLILKMELAQEQKGQL